jgi:hypothetical protein
MDFLGDLVGDVVSDVVVGRAGQGLRRVLGRRGPADGGAGCALKIISGSQDGLSQGKNVKRLMRLMQLDSSRPGSPATMPGTGVSSSRSMTVISRRACGVPELGYRS